MAWPKFFESPATVAAVGGFVVLVITNLAYFAFAASNMVSTTADNKVGLQHQEIIMEEMKKELAKLEENESIQASLALNAKLISDEAVLSKLREDNAVVGAKIDAIKDILSHLQGKMDDQKK